MQSKKFNAILVSFFRKAVVCITAAFLLISGINFQKKASYVVYADEETIRTKIGDFVYFLTFFGINCIAAGQNAATLWNTIKEKYDEWQWELSTGQRMSIDEIVDSVSWDVNQPNVLKLTGGVYNILKAFAEFLGYQSNNGADVLIGQYETETIGTYAQATANQNFSAATYLNYNNLKYKLVKGTKDTRVVSFYKSSNPYLSIYLVSLESFNAASVEGTDINVNINTSNSATAFNYNGNIYYVFDTSLYLYSGSSDPISLVPSYPYISDNNQRRFAAIDYCYGSSSSDGGTELNDIYAVPDQAILDDLIGAADPDSEVQLDLNGSGLPYSSAATLDDLLGDIYDYVAGWILDGSYPDTASKITATPTDMVNEITEVQYPLATTWEVPNILNYPYIQPLISPDCPSFSACLLAGIQDVGATMGNIINTNSNIGNYVSVVLFMGLALWVIGRGL